MSSEWRFNGFPGRVLWVDLTKGTCQPKEIPHDWLMQTMGGKALATKLLVEWDTTDYSEAMKLEHPLGGDSDVARHPTTPLLFMTGPYQASKIGSSGRAVVVTRSPLTDLYIDTYIGGDVGHDLRRAGWDGLFITGKSETLCWLKIEDGIATIEDASHMSGMTTWQVEKTLNGHGKCVSIGPAGENHVRIASPLTDGRRAAGRGGTGASFGFKNLKCFTVKVSAEAKELVKWSDEFSLKDAIGKQRKEMGSRRKVGDPFYSFGTSRGPIYASATNRMPTGNYSSTDGKIPELSQLKVGGGQGGSPDKQLEVMLEIDPVELSGEHWHEQLPNAKQSGCCAPCPIACEASDRIEGVRGKQQYTERMDRPEYETLALLGSNLGIGSSIHVMDGNDACNKVGIDTISAGAALSLICELNARDWLPEDWANHFHAPFDFGSYKQGDVVSWEFGIPELPPFAIHLIGQSKLGDGTLFGSLAGGAVACARYVEKVTGNPATRLTAHSKGLDLPAWDPRGLRGNGMAYMTANVGASHMRAVYKIPTGLPNASAVDLMPELISSQNSIVIRDSMILCAFAKGATPDSVMTQAWNSITGDDAEWSDLLERAAEQWDQARRWNCEHWARLDKDPRGEDKLSWRLRKEPLPTGIAAGMVSFVDDEDEENCLSEYYRLRGWSEQGIPV